MNYEKDFFINSPLEKGDKGGCESEMEEENEKQPPAPPFLRGNISEILRYCQCPAILKGKKIFQRRGLRKIISEEMSDKAKRDFKGRGIFFAFL